MPHNGRCKRGHLFAEVGQDKDSRCRACRLIEQRKYRRRKAGRPDDGPPIPKGHTPQHRATLERTDGELLPGQFLSLKLGDYYKIEVDEHLLEYPIGALRGRAPRGQGWPDCEDYMLLRERLRQVLADPSLIAERPQWQPHQA